MRSWREMAVGRGLRSAARWAIRSAPILAVASTALLAVVLAADAWIVSRAMFAGPPRSVATELYARDGRLFHTLHHRRIVVDPVSAAALDPGRRATIESFLRDAAPRSGVAGRLCALGGVRVALAWHAAALVSNSAPAFPNYALQRVRVYKNALLFAVAVPRMRILDALLNWKPVLGSLYGAQTVARTLHGAGLNELNDAALVEVLGYVYHRRSIPPERRHSSTRALWAADAASRPHEGVAGRYYVDACQRRAGGALDASAARVHTAMDLDLQTFLERLTEEYFVSRERMPNNIRERMEPLPRLQAAAVVIDVATGEVRALVGGTSRDRRGWFNRAVRARRQISSTFKPFLYAEAIERLGYTPATTIEDRPVRLTGRDGSPWRPRNFYSYYMGTVTIHKALAMSINTVSVRLIQRIGVDVMACRARSFFSMPGNDIGRRIRGEPSLALGAVDCTPLELARGYLVLARGGVDADPVLVREVVSTRGRSVVRNTEGRCPRRLLSAETAATVTDILSAVFTPFGTAGAFMGKPLGFEMAGKSGSSPADSWFVGYNPEYLVCAWAGYDDPVAPPDRAVPLFAVIPYWIMLMERCAPRETRFAVPQTLERRSFCADTGLPPDAECPVASGYFMSGRSAPGSVSR